ncbi:MAG: alpha-D-phosphohexomutase [Nitrososphaeraceae archaeon]|jgi:phosphomannomutase|nr:alpha-D-phosphohexomutase [Nitrososphaeraceae archaeon]MCD6036332.1 alpha-D-phosphohexomutase [Nitrososphaeraceae archaeon]MDF2767402.1 alpha-D-phosphohexomutase [Nitrososphaeraceae archaeon]
MSGWLPFMKISISGIRGIYGFDLCLHEIIRFTRLFASIIKLEGRKCVLAQDTRPSSRVISQTVSASLMEQDIDVYNFDVAPTPIVFREARKYGSGFVVTASHNPFEWNGLKFIIKGRGIFEDELHTMLKNTALSSESAAAATSSTGKLGRSFDCVSEYVNEIVNFVEKSTYNRTLKLGLDLGGGATCGYANHLFKKLGSKFYSINDVHGVTSRGPDPTADYLNELCRLVIANELDFGFAFDLDGDRLVVVNRMGEKLSPDATLLICIASAINLGMKKFVTSIDTSIAVEKFIKDHGGRFDFSKVGEANVVSKMLEVDAEAGGEGSSAGFIMPKFNMCRDGFLASAIISSLDKKEIDEYLDFSSQYVQIRSKISADSSLHRKVIEKLTDSFTAESSAVLTIDGIKAIIDDDSWILVRPSNTEHAIRISIESKKANIQSLYKKTREKVQFTYDQIK